MSDETQLFVSLSFFVCGGAQHTRSRRRERARQRVWSFVDHACAGFWSLGLCIFFSRLYSGTRDENDDENEDENEDENTVCFLVGRTLPRKVTVVSSSVLRKVTLLVRVCMCTLFNSSAFSSNATARVLFFVNERRVHQITHIARACAHGSFRSSRRPRRRPRRSVDDSSGASLKTRLHGSLDSTVIHSLIIPFSYCSTASNGVNRLEALCARAVAEAVVTGVSLHKLHTSQVEPAAPPTSAFTSTTLSRGGAGKEKNKKM